MLDTGLERVNLRSLTDLLKNGKLRFHAPGLLITEADIPYAQEFLKRFCQIAVAERESKLEIDATENSLKILRNEILFLLKLMRQTELQPNVEKSFQVLTARLKTQPPIDTKGTTTAAPATGPATPSSAPLSSQRAAIPMMPADAVAEVYEYDRIDLLLEEQFIVPMDVVANYESPDLNISVDKDKGIHFNFKRGAPAKELKSIPFPDYETYSFRQDNGWVWHLLLVDNNYVFKRVAITHEGFVVHRYYGDEWISFDRIGCPPTVGKKAHICCEMQANDANRAVAKLVKINFAAAKHCPDLVSFKVKPKSSIEKVLKNPLQKSKAETLFFSEEATHAPQRLQALLYDHLVVPCEAEGIPSAETPKSDRVLRGSKGRATGRDETGVALFRVVEEKASAAGEKGKSRIELVTLLDDDNVNEVINSIVTSDHLFMIGDVYLTYSEEFTNLKVFGFDLYKKLAATPDSIEYVPGHNVVLDPARNEVQVQDVPGLPASTTEYPGGNLKNPAWGKISNIMDVPISSRDLKRTLKKHQILRDKPAPGYSGIMQSLDKKDEVASSFDFLTQIEEARIRSLQQRCGLAETATSSASASSAQPKVSLSVSASESSTPSAQTSAAPAKTIPLHGRRAAQPPHPTPTSSSHSDERKPAAPAKKV